MLDLATIRKVLRRTIKRLPAWVVELQGKPAVDRDSEYVLITVVLPDAVAFEKIDRHETRPIDQQLRDAFAAEGVEEWIQTRIFLESELAQLAREDRGLPTERLPVRVRRRAAPRRASTIRRTRRSPTKARTAKRKAS